MVLLKDAWMCAMPSDTFFLTFLRARAEAVCCSSWRVGAFRLAIYAAFPACTLSLIAALRGPLRVRALVRVRWPRTGRPLRWRIPRYEPRSMRRLMFMEFSRRRSPSTAVLASTERIALTSTSVRSLTLVVGLMPVALQMSLARERPTPKMCVSPITTCLFIGMLMPAIRAMFVSYLLALALLVPRVRADDVDDAATAHDLAVLADFLDRGTYFHFE